MPQARVCVPGVRAAAFVVPLVALLPVGLLLVRELRSVLEPAKLVALESVDVDPVVLETLCCRTAVSLTTVMLPSPQMQINGNTNVRSPSANNLRAVIGVYNMSVRVSLPYLPLEKLGAEPNCH